MIPAEIDLVLRDATNADLFSQKKLSTKEVI
jgi:hypothetical protein